MKTASSPVSIARKAVGKIMDSVCVFAFYTDEIIPGEPLFHKRLTGLNPRHDDHVYILDRHESNL